MVLLYHDALRRIEQMERKREEGPVGLEEAFEELEKFAGGNVSALFFLHLWLVGIRSVLTF